MPSSVNSFVLLGALATVGHGQFLRSFGGGVHFGSFGDSFTKSWTYFKGQDGRVQKQFESTSIHDGHVQKQMQSTDIIQGRDGMTRKDTKLFCHDGKCEKIEDKIQTPAMPVPPPMMNAPPCQKSLHFLAPRDQEQAQAIALHSRMQALLQHLMGRPQEIMMGHPGQEQVGGPKIIIEVQKQMPQQVPVMMNPYQVTQRTESASGNSQMLKLGGIFCGTMALLSLLLLAAKCRQTDVSAREAARQGLGAPLASGEEVATGISSAKVAIKDIASVKSAVSKYLPQLYECAQVKAAVSIYLPRVYARATA